MSKEALRLALEALEYIYEGANNQGPHTGISWRCVSKKAAPVITALRQALANEALDKMAENARELGLDYEPAQQQEPVAWLHTKIEGVAVPHRPADLDKHPDRWTALYPEPKPCPTCEALARTVMLDQTSHDTFPPAQRTWVGLTDEELKPLCDENHIIFGAYTVDFIQAIEAKLREKNNG